MYKLFQVSIFSLMILIAGETTVSASESDWNAYTTTDKLTGKVSDPFLRYRVNIPNTSKGIFNLQVSCEKQVEILGQKIDSPIDEKFRFIKHELKIFNAPLLKPELMGSSIRQIDRDGVVRTMGYLPSPQYRNNYFGQIVNVSLMSNYSNLPTKQEFVFEDGNSIIVEFGRKYLSYVTSCFAGRECARKSVCGPAL